MPLGYNETMSDEFPLFSGPAPGSEHLHLQEERFSAVDEKTGREQQHVRRVLHPSIYTFLPAAGSSKRTPSGQLPSSARDSSREAKPVQHPAPNHNLDSGRDANQHVASSPKNGGHIPAILIIPGGGYQRQVLSKEGFHIAQWLNGLGIAAFVLKHRMPGDGHTNDTQVPLQDAQRALRLIRFNAESWGVDSSRIGVMGFSAGGHVAATLCTNFDAPVYQGRDAADALSARPDFAALIYPVISFHSYGEGKDDDGRDLPQHARERGDIIRAFPADEMLRPDTPATFLAGADDDEVTPMEHCCNYYRALRKQRIPSELHIFRNGGHGFGLGTDRGKVDQWPALFAQWLELQLGVPLPSSEVHDARTDEDATRCAAAESR